VSVITGWHRVYALLWFEDRHQRVAGSQFTVTATAQQVFRAQHLVFEDPEQAKGLLLTIPGLFHNPHCPRPAIRLPAAMLCHLVGVDNDLQFDAWTEKSLSIQVITDRPCNGLRFGLVISTITRTGSLTLSEEE
jgi:hypothetical protein